MLWAVCFSPCHMKGYKIWDELAPIPVKFTLLNSLSCSTVLSCLFFFSAPASEKNSFERGQPQGKADFAMTEFKSGDVIWVKCGEWCNSH